MSLAALIPPLWRRVMNPRVIAHYQGDMSQANIKPSIRAQVVAQYPARA
jgi:alkane 1-monooxygenase